MGFNYNRVTLVGCVTKDPDFKEVSGGRLFFILAVRRNQRVSEGKNKSDYSDFIPVVLWGKLATTGSRLLKAGSPILVEGRVQTRHLNQEDGRRYFTEIIGNNFQLLGSKPAEVETYESEESEEDVLVEK